MPAHHDGERLRRRRHDGRWQKMELRAVLPPKWKAARKRKRLGVAEVWAERLQPFMSSLAMMDRIGQQYLDGVVAGLAMNVLGEEEQEEAP